MTAAEPVVENLATSHVVEEFVIVAGEWKMLAVLMPTFL